MIPTGGSIKNAPIEEVQQPSLTWYMDFKRGRITGLVNGIEAIKQTVFQILQTQRFRHLIYSFNYGNELYRLIGIGPLFQRSEASRMIQEALSQDDRIQDIENVQVEITGDNILISFNVVTVLGTFQIEQEVISNVRAYDV